MDGHVVCNDEIVAAILAVYRAPWDDVPECPFIIELFTDRAHRRRGLARVLLAAALRVAYERGASAMALRVDAENHAARTLYADASFTPWKATR